MDAAEKDMREMMEMFEDEYERVRRLTYHYVGLSIGTRSQRTGLCVVEQPPAVEDGQARNVRWLERFQAGTSYPVIVNRTAEVVEQIKGTANLIIDITAVGPPVMKMFQEAITDTLTSGATITGGFAVNAETYRNVSIPKRDLVSTVEVLLQTDRLRIAPKLEETETLRRALEDFQLKPKEITAEANSMLWREESDDDLVFAVALACWEASRAHHWIHV